MKPEIRKTRYCLIAITGLLMVLLAQPALAATKTWVGPNPDMNWTTANNWNPIGMPGASDIALLTSTTSKTATLNTATPLLKSVTINATGGATFTLTQSSPSTALSAGSETIGTNGNGTYDQSDGSNTVTNALTLGQNVGGSGIYNMSGLLQVGGAEYIGQAGAGSFTQDSGSHTIGGLLAVGNQTGSSGIFTMGSGLLQVGSSEYIGQAGTGSFSQIGGSHTIRGQLAVGNQTGSSGIYTMGGGLLQVGGAEVIGQAGTGSFSQIGGSHTIRGQLAVGNQTGSSGIYTMGGGLLQVGGGEYIGNNGIGSFTQTSGTHTIGGLLAVGNQTGSFGTYTMGSGLLQVAGGEYIGNKGPGSFTQSSGTHTIGGSLAVGNQPGISGTYNMGSGSLAVGSNEYIGASGIGSFTQTSGSHTIGGLLAVGNQTGSSGAYTLTSGSLSVGGAEVIGNNGLGSFTQDIGSNSANTITLAKSAGSFAAYNLNGGGVSVSSSALNAIHINGSTSSPGAGTGIFNVTGTATVTGNVTNDGNVKTTGANVTWNGTFTNNNVYTSDPSTQTFTDLKVKTTGYLVGNSPLLAGNPQDLFIFKNNFQNQSAQNTLWNTETAEMQFVGASGTNHTLYVPGVDNGKPSMLNNFNWYELDITNQNLHLKDGNAGNASTAQYFGVINGLSITGTTVNNIFGDLIDTVKLYYVPALNPGLGGLDYTFASGRGGLFADDPIISSAVPLPPSVLLLGSGLLGLGILGWRRKKG